MRPAAYPYTPIDRERIARQRERLVVGGIDSVKARLLALIEATRADELMITTMAFDHAARRRSYELLAEAFALTPKLSEIARHSGCLKFVMCRRRMRRVANLPRITLNLPDSILSPGAAVATCQCVH